MTGILGALLIGGGSTRMGRPKQLLPLKGTTSGAYLCRLLYQVTGQAPLLVGKGSIGKETGNYRRVLDREPGAGPLSAVLGLFDESDEKGTTFLVLATDLLAMNAPALGWLLQQRPPKPNLVTWPQLPGRSHGEPLAGLYLSAAAGMLERAWSDGERSLHRALPKNRIYQPLIPLIYRPAFTNVNQPKDFKAILGE